MGLGTTAVRPCDSGPLASRVPETLVVRGSFVSRVFLSIYLSISHLLNEYYFFARSERILVIAAAATGMEAAPRR